MIQIFIFIIILIVFFAITSWKFAPYAFVALIMLAVHNTSDLCFIADNKLATTIFLMLVFFGIVWLLLSNRQTGLALYSATALIVSHILLSIALSFISTYEFVSKHRDIIHVIILLIMFVCCLVVAAGNERFGYAYTGNLLLMIFLRCVASLIYGYAILMADYVRYDIFITGGENPLTMPVFPMSEIKVLPEKWILLALFLLIVALGIGVDIRNKKAKSY